MFPTKTKYSKTVKASEGKGGGDGNQARSTRRYEYKFGKGGKCRTRGPSGRMRVSGVRRGAQERDGVGMTTPQTIGGGEEVRAGVISVKPGD